MATVVLKRLGRRTDFRNQLFRIQLASKPVNNHTSLMGLRRRFSVFAPHPQGSKSDFIFFVPQAFRGLHDQALAASDASDLQRVYKDADEQAAASALQSHLQKHSKAYLSDAAAVVANAPSFVKQLVNLVKQERQERAESVKDGPDSNLLEKMKAAGAAKDEMDSKASEMTMAMKVTDDLKTPKKDTFPKKNVLSIVQGDSELSFEKQVLIYLSAENINVLDPIMESVGVESERLQSLQQKLTQETVDVQLFLFVIRWLERLGLSRNCVGEIFEKETGILSLKGDDIERVFSILKALSISEEDILKLIKRYPLILKAEVADNIDALRSELRELPSSNIIISKAICRVPESIHSYEKGCAEAVLQYLRSYGLQEERLDQLLQRNCRLLFLDVETKLKSKVNFLKELGLSRVVIGKVLKRTPAFLLRNLEESLKSRLTYFKSLGISDAEFASMVSRYPSIFSASLDNKIKPAVAELRTLGLSEEGLKKVVIYRPSLFAYKLGGEISSLVSGLKETDYSDHQKVTAFIKLYSRGIDHRKRCEDCLVRYGLTASEAKQVLDKEPTILGFDEEGLSSRLDHLTGTLGVPVQNVISAPSYLSAGFKSRFLRRQRVLAYMKSKGLLATNVTLKHVVSPSNVQFYKKFVKPHAEDKELSKIWHKERKGMGEEDGLYFILNYPAETSEPVVNA